MVPHFLDVPLFSVIPPDMRAPVKNTDDNPAAKLTVIPVKSEGR